MITEADILARILEVSEINDKVPSVDLMRADLEAMVAFASDDWEQGKKDDALRTMTHVVPLAAACVAYLMQRAGATCD